MTLRIHIKQNVLYYMQAIWAHEEPDQRFFRLYRKKVVCPAAQTQCNPNYTLMSSAASTPGSIDLETVLSAQPNSPLSRALLDNGRLRTSPIRSTRPDWRGEPRWIEAGHSLSGRAGYEDVLFVQTKAFNRQWSADLERTGYVQAEFALIIDHVAVHPRTAWELVERGYLERAAVENARKIPLVE